MRRATIVICILGAILMLSSALYIYFATIRAGSYMAEGVVVVVPMRYDRDFLFDAEQVAEWANRYEGMVGTEQITTAAVEGQGVRGFAGVSRVGRDYFQMTHLTFVSGSPWQGEGQRVAIICWEMAWTLFGAQDVVNFVINIGEEQYVVAGVVDTDLRASATIDGFVWIPGDNSEVKGIVYLKPISSNLVTARLDAEGLLYHLEHRYEDFTITDINAYVSSIALRGKILLALGLPLFIFVLGRWLYKLFELRERKRDSVIAVFFAVAAIAIIVSYLVYLMSIDLWMPAFMGEGLSAFRQLIFNTGFLAPRIYLPAGLAALLDLNTRANIAFGAGVFGIGIVWMAIFLSLNVLRRKLGE
jgi:hypothetical protein